MRRVSLLSKEREISQIHLQKHFSRKYHSSHGKSSRKCCSFSRDCTSILNTPWQTTSHARCNLHSNCLCVITPNRVRCLGKYQWIGRPHSSLMWSLRSSNDHSSTLCCHSIDGSNTNPHVSFSMTYSIDRTDLNRGLGIIEKVNRNVSSAGTTMTVKISYIACGLSLVHALSRLSQTVKYAKIERKRWKIAMAVWIRRLRETPLQN